MCILGNRLLKDVPISECNKTEGTFLHNIFCNNTAAVCDPYFLNHNVSVIRGIKGLSSGVLLGKHC